MKILPYVLAAAIGFGIGNIHSCNSKYEVKNEKGRSYLCIKSTNQCERITDDFQLGSLEYRLDGIKREVAGLGLIENEYERRR